MIVLVVDANEAFREALCAFLESEGYTTVEASDGVEGMALARQLLPNAIIVDVDVPGPGGWEMIEQLDGEPLLSRVPRFVLVTEAPDGLMHVAGARVFRKPSDPEELLYAMRVLTLRTGRFGQAIPRGRPQA